MTALPERSERRRRDVTCATAGHKGCNWSCKLRGKKEGSCAWNTETGAYNCECSKERRGIRLVLLTKLDEFVLNESSS